MISGEIFDLCTRELKLEKNAVDCLLEIARLWSIGGSEEVWGQVGHIRPLACYSRQ